MDQLGQDASPPGKGSSSKSELIRRKHNVGESKQRFRESRK